MVAEFEGTLMDLRRAYERHHFREATIVPSVCP